MESTGSLIDGKVCSILHDCMEGQYSGKLSLSATDGRTGEIVLLIGQAIHAVAGEIIGDAAILAMMHWNSGLFQFDENAPVGVDENVTRHLGDLLSECPPLGSQEATSTTPTEEPVTEREHDTVPVMAIPVFHERIETWGDPPTSLPTEDSVVTHKDPEPIEVPEVNTPLAEESQVQPEPEVVSPPVHEWETHDIDTASPTPYSYGAEEVQPTQETAPVATTPSGVDGLRHRPTPDHAREPLPLPGGDMIYETLQTSFLDLSKLFTTLSHEQFTGYLKLLNKTSIGVMFIREGAAQECLYDGGKEISGDEAAQMFCADVMHGYGILDMVQLPLAAVDALRGLVSSSPVYSELETSWAEPKALLTYLLDKKHLSGSMVLRSDVATGVILLSEGEVVGAYTDSSRDISSDTEQVFALAKEGSIMEVRASAAATQALATDQAMEAASSMPEPEPEAVVEPEPEPVIEPEPEPEAVVEPEPAWELPAPTPSEPVLPIIEPETTWDAPVEAEVPSWDAPKEESPDETLRMDEPVVAPALPDTTIREEALPVAHVSDAETMTLDTMGDTVHMGEPFNPNANNLDWEQIVLELQGLADEKLGGRARRAKNLLAASERTPEALEATFKLIEGLSLLFVENHSLQQLADSMRELLKQRMG